MQPRTKQGIRLFLKSVLLLFTAMILAGSAYEQIGERQDRKRFPQSGRSVDIGGRSLNIYCSGEGGPAVILDTGGSAPGYSNVVFQREVAQFTRACWFDRAGLGWSDPSPVEQTSTAVAEDLHALLHAAGVPSPYVLVGSSFSGFNVRVLQANTHRKLRGRCWWIRHTKINTVTNHGLPSLPSTGFQSQFEIYFALACQWRRAWV